MEVGRPRCGREDIRNSKKRFDGVVVERNQTPLEEGGGSGENARLRLTESQVKREKTTGSVPSKTEQVTI